MYIYIHIYIYTYIYTVSAKKNAHFFKLVAELVNFWVEAEKSYIIFNSSLSFYEQLITGGQG